MDKRIINDISDFIFVADEPIKADAIFLPGGSYPEQPEYAAELYKMGLADWVIASGGISARYESWPGVKSKSDKYKGDYRSDCEFLRDVLIKNSVAREAIICEYEARHTRDNAFLSRRVSDEKGIKPETALLVCKSFHARRCLMLYGMAFPDTIIKVCPVDCLNIRKDNWYKSEQGIDRVLGELSRCGSQFCGDIKNFLAEYKG